MKITNNRKLTTVQMGIFKVSMIAFGVAVANTWPGFFSGYTTLAWIVALVGGVYIAVIWHSQ